MDCVRVDCVRVDCARMGESPGRLSPDVLESGRANMLDEHFPSQLRAFVTNGRSKSSARRSGW